MYILIHPVELNNPKNIVKYWNLHCNCAATECAIKRSGLQQAEAEELRHKVCSNLVNTKLPRPNLTPGESKALKTLGKDEDIVILPADKGKCVVVLHKKDYDSKCQDLLKDKKTYKPIGYNPTSGYRKRVVDFVNELESQGTIDTQFKYKLLPPSEPNVPAFYGLPKIHKKEPIPVRPITSSIGSVTYKLAKYGAKILGPLVGKSKYSIKNTQEFVNDTNGLVLEDGEIFISYDIIALFTAVPSADAISVARKRLESDPTLKDRTNLTVDQIVKLLTICLETAYFSYGGQFYLQQHGCAMGSPLSPILVNLYMEEFEVKALSTFSGDPPSLWKRYVDDTAVKLKQSESETFFDHINNVDKEHIQFTREECQDNKLPFLDCLICINEDRTISTEVYRKPTHTDHYLQFDSHHPLVHKLSVIRTLFHRADTVVSNPAKISQEKEYVKSALRDCQYPDWAFIKAQKQSDKQTPSNAENRSTNKAKASVGIPYVQGLSERIKKTLKPYGITTFFKPYNKLRQSLVHVKDKKPKEKCSHIVQWWLQVVQGPSASWLKLQWGDNLCEMCDITHHDAT